MYNASPMFWGRIGFDVSTGLQSACQDCSTLVKQTTKKIVANNDNYALAA